MPNVTYLINADLFGKLPPPYYLDRRHHFGTIDASDIEGLQDIIADIIANSSIYIDPSCCGGITTDLSTSHVWYDLSLPPATSMPVDVGGIPAGTTAGDLYAMNMTDLLNWLLFGGNMYPTYVAPSSLFSCNVSLIQQVGATMPITFTITYNPGDIMLGEIRQNDRAGAAISYNYTGSNLTSPTSSNSQTTSPNYTIVAGSQTWRGSVNYAQGPQPLDAAGNPYESPLSAGTTPFGSVTIEGTYPLFATTVEINTLTAQSLVSMSSTIVEFDRPLVPEANYQGKQKFDIPTVWASLPLVGIQTYNTTSGLWEYEGGNQTTSLARWTTSSVTHDVSAGTINYTRYTYNGPDRSSIEIRLIF